MKTLSIVIPVYNRAHIVQRTLTSVLNQDYRPLQVILVDNYSTDNTLDVLNSFASQYQSHDLDIKVIQESTHTAGAARNSGAKLASGEWIMFFDSDDEMSSNLVSSYLKCIESHNDEVDIISTGAVIKFTDGTQRALPFFTHDILAVQILHSQLATQRYIVRKQFFNSCGQWNPSLPGWNDWELGMRLLLNKPRILYISGTPVTVNHSGEHSITGNNFHSKAGQWEHVIDIVEQNINHINLHNKARYLRLLEYKRLVLAAQYQREGVQQLALNLRNSAMTKLKESYGNSMKWNLFISPIVRWLYNRIAHGKRGAARIAIKIFN